MDIEEGNRQKKRQRSSLLFGGEEFIKFLATLALPKTILNKRMNSSFYSILNRPAGAIHPIIQNRPRQNS